MELMIGEIDNAQKYGVGPFDIYILKYEKRYLPRIPYKYVSYLPVIRDIIKNTRVSEGVLEIENFTFDEVFSIIKGRVSKKISSTVDEEENEQISELITWEYMNLSRIAPLLLDSNIDEFFIDGPYSTIYLLHSKFGRLDTDISITPIEINAIKTYLEVFKGREAIRVRGTLKSELISKRFHYRVNYDMDPICVDGPSISFRNLKRGRFTLVELIKNKTITIDAAAFLILTSWLKGNITIIGEVGSGKTTLLNCIDIFLPSSWRKIYIEEAIESVPQRDLGKHQVRYRSEIFTNIAPLSRLWQVTFTLHRSPDYLILGEILTDDDVRTWLYSLTCGLSGIQTMHSNDIYDFIRRLILYHKIPVTGLETLDFIVLMRKLERRELIRVVYGIYELRFNDDNNIDVVPIFEYSRNIKSLQIKTPFNKSRVISKLLSKNLLDEDWFYVAYDAIKRKLTLLLDKRNNLPSLVNVMNTLYEELFRGKLR